MIVAIMQPYFFPYIGYFQLMHAVDTFVLFDDVQYIDRGWVNRNRISLAGKAAWLSMPVAHADRGLAINQRRYLLDTGVLPIKRKVREAYRSDDDYGMLDAIDTLLDFADPNVARFNAHALRAVAGWLGIDCRFAVASELMDGEERPRGERGVLELCRRLGATHYVNAIGGVTLYDPANFANVGIQLSFLRTQAPASHTVDGPTHLSIIDLLVRHGTASCRGLLPMHELLGAQDARRIAS